ncbi:hypothetical protein CXF68_18535 [Tenacibaculum sp. Bg11-29]|uniref:hypothetical protein n=1 Tax=Tenacibaculum sp. Bg11-29 TaxID=2058306 RepID=UPI000C34DF61|nr:hypothetical protein [Tenacibaculum sp. Bg11-29]PKH52575.1 hypothetical protein CXF68_18535 [Tenacibaculum sp. Bg11-29]
MKSYFKYKDENNTECFLELDEELYCERAIYKTKNNLTNTYLTIEHESFFLPEGNLKDSLEFMNYSSKEEFDILWKKSMIRFESNWNKLKMKYKIGEKIKTHILCFYPQGIISNFGEKFNAISNFKACEEKFGKEKMYPNNEMELIISDFDDINKIVQLKTN